MNITGKVSNPNKKNISLEVYGHNMIYTDTVLKTSLDKENRFQISLELNKLKDAFLFIGDEMATIFIEPTDSLYIEVDAKEFDETIYYEGQGAPKMNYLAKKFLMLENLRTEIAQSYIAPSDKFIVLVDSAEKLQKEFWKEAKAENAFSENFLMREETQIRYYSANYKLGYPSIHQYFSPSKEHPALPESYYSFMDSLEINNDSLLISSTYRDFLHEFMQHIREQIWTNNPILKNDIDPYNMHKAIYKGKTLDCALMNCILLLVENLSYKELASYYQDFIQICDNQEYINLVKDVVTQKNKLAAGNLAPDFTLKNTNNEKVYLSDFRGKVVFLEFWATWCKPCIHEIPYLEELADYFTNKDVVFIKVAIDIDVEGWKNFVKTRNLQGINLIAPEHTRSQVSKDYLLDGVPYYFIIDKEGKFLSSPAPSPHQKDLIIQLIDQSLKD